MSNKVLVTGASGLLGVAAIEKFLSAGWEVIGVSRREPELFTGRDIEFVSVDLRDREAARSCIRADDRYRSHRLHGAA
jgi:nucleoside-diphosphate-sugar epimerase